MAIMSKHTPGPWSYWPNSCEYPGVITQDETALHIAVPTALPNVQANARLIAAAPDLLAALKDCRSELVYILESYGDLGVGFDRAIGAADAAIAKAEGGDHG
jgi:hypothetical protein